MHRPQPCDPPTQPPPPIELPKETPIGDPPQSPVTTPPVHDPRPPHDA